MRIEHTVHAELKLKYEKALEFIRYKVLAYERCSQKYLEDEANKLLKELGE